MYGRGALECLSALIHTCVCGWGGLVHCGMGGRRCKLVRREDEMKRSFDCLTSRQVL